MHVWRADARKRFAVIAKNNDADAKSQNFREWGGFLYLQTENYPHSILKHHLGGSAYAATS